MGEYMDEIREAEKKQEEVSTFKELRNYLRSSLGYKHGFPYINLVDLLIALENRVEELEALIKGDNK